MAVASIEDDFITGGSKDRTAADLVEIIIFLKPIFKAVGIIPGAALKDSLPNDIPYVGFVAPVLISRIISQAFVRVTEQADYNDRLVQGAEIEALYEENPPNA